MNSRENRAPYVHWRTIPFGDTDAAAIVYTPRFSDYCMEAVEIWFREYIGVDWFHMNTELGLGTPVVHIETSFKAPLIAGDELGVVVRVASVGRSAVTLALEGRRKRAQAAGQITAFNARYVFCFTEKGKGAIAIPANRRERIEAYWASCEASETFVTEDNPSTGAR